MLKQIDELNLADGLINNYIITDTNITVRLPKEFVLSKFDSQVGPQVNKIIKFVSKYSFQDDIYRIFNSELFKKHNLSEEMYFKISPSARQDLVKKVLIDEIKQVLAMKGVKL